MPTATTPSAISCSRAGGSSLPRPARKTCIIARRRSTPSGRRNGRAWAGPVSNWIKACELMLSWDLEAVVPGHGAMTDKSGIREFRDYLSYVRAESRKCFDEGLSFEEAADRISLDPWAHFAEDERMYVN